ncbi:hypothetical protein EMIT0P44_20290 [Pseudomonas sp. IT-P44]
MGFMSILRAKDKWIARPDYTSHAMVSEVLVPLMFVIQVQQAGDGRRTAHQGVVRRRTLPPSASSLHALGFSLTSAT